MEYRNLIKRATSSLSYKSASDRVNNCAYDLKVHYRFSCWTVSRKDTQIATLHACFCGETLVSLAFEGYAELSRLGFLAG